MRPEIPHGLIFQYFHAFAIARGCFYEPPGLEKHAAPKQVIAFAMKIIKNIRILKKAQKSDSQGLKFIEKMSKKIKKNEIKLKKIIKFVFFWYF